MHKQICRALCKIMQSVYVSKDDIQVQPEFSQLKIIAEYDM